MMKRIAAPALRAFGLIGLLIGGYSAAGAAEGPKILRGYYYPECRLRLVGPVTWYARNETQSTMGIIYLTQEEMNSSSSIYKTGIVIMRNHLDLARLHARTSEELANRMRKAPPPNKNVRISENFNIETPIGTFVGYKSKVKTADGGTTISVNAYLVPESAEPYILTYESPEEDWPRNEKTMLDILKSLRQTCSGEVGDITTYSTYDHPYTSFYRLRSPDLIDVLKERIGQLHIGMDEEDYHRVMDYRTEDKPDPAKHVVYRNVKTEGWINKMLTSPDGKAYVEIFGTLHKCVTIESFAVTLHAGKITHIDRLGRTSPEDFNLATWDQRFAGTSVSDLLENPVVDHDLRQWARSKEKANSEFDRVAPIAKGMDEQTYLNAAHAFGYNVYGFINRVIPGVLSVVGPGQSKNGKLTTIYVYGYREGTQSKSVGVVLVENGIVTQVERQEMVANEGHE